MIKVIKFQPIWSRIQWDITKITRPWSNFRCCCSSKLFNGISINFKRFFKKFVKSSQVV